MGFQKDLSGFKPWLLDGKRFTITKFLERLRATVAKWLKFISFSFLKV